MPSKKKDRRQVAGQLKQLQDEHSRLLKKVEKARTKFEKRSRKLQSLESDIAKLERRSYDPQAERLGQASDGDKNLRHALLIYNPKSGAKSNGGVKLEQVVGCLRTHGIIAEIGLKTSGKAARKLAKEAADKDEDLVIVAAGDGTVEEVASQLVGSKTTLGIVPIGTMNNLARGLGIPLELDDACQLLGMGVSRQIDVGHVHANEKPDVEYFLETAGFGLSAVAIPAGQAAEKGRWSALPNALRKVFDSKPASILVEFDDGESIQAKSEVVTVSNAPLMGNNIMVAPDAKMDDGLLDVAVYDGMSKADLLSYFVSANSGKRATNASVRFHRAQRVRITSDEPLDAHSDKDVIDGKEVLEENSSDSQSNRSDGKKYVLEIEVVPQALSVIVGKGIALTLPVEVAASVPPLSGPQAGNGSKPKQDEKDDKK